jgi:hypothetical protein
MARLKLYELLMFWAWSVSDTVHSEHLAQEVVTIADSLTQAERDSEALLPPRRTGPYEVPYTFLEAIARRIAFGERALLDSLRRSTAAYTGVVGGLWSKATGMRPDAMASPIGKQATPITADFWFPRDSARAPRPTPGRVALVVFFEGAKGCNAVGWAQDDKLNEAGGCWSDASAVRRLAERFPALQITVVASTDGYFLYGPPVPPPQEAELIARWTAAKRLPGVLAVTATSFWHLEAPDDRRIDKPRPNVTAYRFGQSWSIFVGTYFLIDREGVIVDGGPGSLYQNEANVGELIDVLIHRHN